MTILPTWWPPCTPADYGHQVESVERAYEHMYGRQRGRGIAAAAMVLGIIATAVFAAPVLSYAAVVLAAIATGLGIAALRRSAGRGMAIAGLVLGPLALVGAIGMSVYWTGLFVDQIRVAQQCAQDHPRLGPAYDRCISEGGDPPPSDLSDPSDPSAGGGQPA